MISLQVLAAVLLTGCPALAHAPVDAPDGWPSDSLRRQVWGLGAWVAPDGAAPEGLELRPDRVSDGRAAGGRSAEGRALVGRDRSAPERVARNRPKSNPDATGPAAPDLTAPDLAASARGRSEDGGRVVRRSVAVPDPEGAGGGRELGLTMTFDGPLAAWPRTLAARCRPAAGAAPVDVFDARPFGGPNLAGIAPELLESCLASLAGLLAKGPRLAPFSMSQVEPGLSMAAAEARFGPRLGSREVVLFRLSPSRFRLVPRHEDEDPRWRERPGTIGDWAARLPGAALIANAGQYYPDRRHMGLLRRDGTDLSGARHGQWKGFLVQDRLPGPGQARGFSDWAIIDEDTRQPGAPGPDEYATAVQSHMILDRLGRVRVRSSERLASRSALGVDSDGNLWLVAVMGAISLEDLAAILAGLPLVAAIGLDGGHESQVALSSGGRTTTWLGRHTNNFLGNFMADMPAALPAVIAFERIGDAGEADSPPDPASAPE